MEVDRARIGVKYDDALQCQIPLSSVHVEELVEMGSSWFRRKQMM